MRTFLLALLSLTLSASDRSYYVNRKVGHAVVGMGRARTGLP